MELLMKCMALSAIVVTLITSEAIMQALQVAGLGTLFGAAFISLIYGEISLLYRK